MSWKCITFDDRKKIEQMYAEDKKPYEIANVVGVTVATIYRELKRGYTGELNANYCPAYSAENAEKEVRRSVRNRGRRKRNNSAYM